MKYSPKAVINRDELENQIIILPFINPEHFKYLKKLLIGQTFHFCVVATHSSNRHSLNSNSLELLVKDSYLELLCQLTDSHVFLKRLQGFYPKGTRKSGNKT